MKLIRPIEVSCPSDSGIERVTIDAGTTGVVTSVLPTFQVRLTDIYDEKVQSISWHCSLKVVDDIVAIDSDAPKLWLVK